MAEGNIPQPQIITVAKKQVRLDSVYGLGDLGIYKDKTTVLGCNMNNEAANFAYSNTDGGWYCINEYRKGQTVTVTFSYVNIGS